MTLLRKLRIQYGGLVVVVALLMGLNVGELIWINSWQGQTDVAMEDAQAAGELTIAVETMTESVENISGSMLNGYGLGELESTFRDEGAVATQSLDSILANKEPGSAEAAEAESLKRRLDEFLLAGNALAKSEDIELTNVITRTTPLRSQGHQLGIDIQVFRYNADSVIAAKLDRLGTVGLVCLIISAALGIAAVAAGAILGWLLPRSVGRTLNEAVTGISSSAAELMAVASQVAASAAQTAASTNETTVTVEEVKQTAVLAHEKASEAAEGAQRATQTAESGRTLTEETISGVERVRDEMDVVFETITRLREQTQAAGDVIASVNDLAEQSNLLSVNASIEAAKAGEYGKGFTVVAQEVKNLAEQSKQAVAQVRTMLSDIQKASQTAVEAAERSRQAVETGRQQSIEAGDVMQSLAGGADDNAQSLVQISASSQQQLAGMEQIAQAIESINEAGSQAAGGTRQVEQEVQHLQDLATRLKRLVEATNELNRE